MHRGHTPTPEGFRKGNAIDGHPTDSGRNPEDWDADGAAVEMRCGCGADGMDDIPADGSTGIPVRPAKRDRTAGPVEVRPHGERRHGERPEHAIHKPIGSMRPMGRRDSIHHDMGGDSICGMEEGGTMCRPAEDADRISREAETMRAEEHLDAMDEDACEDGDYAGEGMEEDAE